MEVLDRAAALTDCDSIGLRLGLRHSLAAMGPVGAASLTCPSSIARVCGTLGVPHRLGVAYRAHGKGCGRCL
jgi:hypothetical protein